MREHEEKIRQFFRDCKQNKPELLEEVMKKYPTISYRGRRNIRRAEQTCGLLGLQPANLPDYIAFEYGFESVFNRELEGDQN